jgi:hypothetical protein
MNQNRRIIIETRPAGGFQVLGQDDGLEELSVTLCAGHCEALETASTLQRSTGFRGAAILDRSR